MIKKEILKKQIIYRSVHRGTKEMDILLGSFVNKYINDFSISELEDLKMLLEMDDDIISSWYFDLKNNEILAKNKIAKKLKKFKP